MRGGVAGYKFSRAVNLNMHEKRGEKGSKGETRGTAEGEGDWVVSRATSLTPIEGCLAEVTRADELQVADSGSHGSPSRAISFSSQHRLADARRP